MVENFRYNCTKYSSSCLNHVTLHSMVVAQHGLPCYSIEGSISLSIFVYLWLPTSKHITLTLDGNQCYTINKCQVSILVAVTNIP